MPTKLTKPVSRETNKHYGCLPVILTIAPCRGQDEALIGMRLKGRRTEYVMRLSDVYRQAALQHGQKLASAKRAARKMGVPWRMAKKKFDRENRIVNFNEQTKTNEQE